MNKKDVQIRCFGIKEEGRPIYRSQQPKPGLVPCPENSIYIYVYDVLDKRSMFCYIGCKYQEAMTQKRERERERNSRQWARGMKDITREACLVS